MRVFVSVIVDNVAAGMPREEILRNYAALTDPDVDAALAYAAELTCEGTVDLPREIEVESQSRRESSNRIRVDPVRPSTPCRAKMNDLASSVVRKGSTSRLGRQPCASRCPKL
jgi:uncharacterized protein DUF433